jgi:diguanylate cyclase (GGDEF)-like protein
MRETKLRRREWRAWVTLALSGVFVVFASWCVSLVIEVPQLRHDLGVRVRLLMTTQEVQAWAQHHLTDPPQPAAAAVGPAEPAAAPHAEKLRRASRALERVASYGGDPRVALELAALELAALEGPTGPSSDDHAWARVLGALDQAVIDLRLQNAAISARLHRTWDSLYLLVVGSLVLLTSNMLLLHFAVRGRRALETAQASLREAAIRDALTGLWNRRMVLERLGDELARVSREHGTLGVIMLDIDDFKSVNDRHGHLVGDAVLIEVARRLAAQMRPYDAIGRYGGEEFLVLAPGCDAASGAALAERLRSAVGGARINAGESRDLEVTVSLGVTVVDQDQDLRPEVVLSAADVALYQAKGAGRNRQVTAPSGSVAPGPGAPPPAMGAHSGRA